MTCEEITYRINDVDLHDPDNGFRLMVGTEYAPPLSPRHAVVEVPGVHGALPLWDDPLSEIAVTLVCRVLAGDSPDVLRERWNTFINLLGTGTNQPIELSRVRGDHVDYADAQLLTTTAPVYDAAQRWIEITLVLNIPSGRWGGEVEEQTLSQSGASQTSEIGLNSSMPVSNSQIMVDGPLATITITDDVSNTGIEWGGNVLVPASSYLFVDTRTMRAYIKDEPDWEASGTEASGTLAFIGHGPLTLTSKTTGAGKESSISVTSSGGSDGGTFVLRARPATA